MKKIKCLVHTQHFVHPLDTDFTSTYIMTSDGAGLVRATPDMDEWNQFKNDVLISDLFVVESRRHQHIATTLLKKAEEVYAGQNKTFWLKLSVHNPLPYLHDFYLKMGYVDSEKYNDFIYMTKHIN